MTSAGVRQVGRVLRAAGVAFGLYGGWRADLRTQALPGGHQYGYPPHGFGGRSASPSGSCPA
jgi:hypothetical protein